MAAVNGTNHSSTEVEGRVVRVNDRGLLLDGRPSWLNISRFAGAVTLPAVGDVVRLTLDGSGFIRAIAPAVSEITPMPAAVPTAVSVAQDTPAAGPSKDTVITRLAVLKAAAQFCQYRPDVTDDDVLSIAAKWEGWVTR